MNRKLTDYELTILNAKCNNWAFGNEIKNGMIELGNGIDHEPTALLPYEMFINPNIFRIEKQHVILINKLSTNTNELPIIGLTTEDIQTIKYAEECLVEELSLNDYSKDFRPRWNKLLNKIGLKQRE